MTARQVCTPVQNGSFHKSQDLLQNVMNKNFLPGLCQITAPHCVGGILNEILKAINDTFTGLKLVIQGFRIYIVRNPRIKDT